MRAKLVLAVVLSLPASILAGPASAGAKATLPPRSHPVAQLELKGAGGYLLTFFGNRRTVGLLALKGLGALAAYETPGRVTPAGIRARFGRLGKIAVKFRPTGRVKRKRPPRGCRGAVRKTFPGVFVGTIKFRGEQGYTRGGARRARGSMEIRSAWRCKGRQNNKDKAAEPSLPDLGADTVALQATSTRGRLAFLATAYRPPEERGLTLFSASSTERRGRMNIERAAISLGRERTFVFDADLGTASISPPHPFTGSATLAPGPDGASAWTGSLKVDLPGRKDVPLATPSFTAHLFQPSP